ncbi:MAG: OmpA family protein, partial [Rhodospirillales bacterium]
VAATPAPAAPPPVPQVPGTYLVFFDFDRAELRPDSSEVVRTAAANAKIGKITRLMATGHADRSGTNRYNLALSERRAESVRAELVRQGIPADQIVITFKGEAEPLVPTEDGVREPQNRRVEIIFQ